MTKQNNRVDKKVSLDEISIRYVQTFADEQGTGFSEALRFLILHNLRGRIIMGVPDTLILEAATLGVDISRVIKEELARQIKIKRDFIKEERLIARAAMCNLQE